MEEEGLDGLASVNMLGATSAAEIDNDALGSAEIAVKKMDGIKLRAHTLSVALAGGGGKEHGGRPY